MLIARLEPAVADFEDCQNLDEECFEVDMKFLTRVSLVILRGTPIDENSETIKNANGGRTHEHKIHFIFGPKLHSKHMDGCCGNICCKSRGRELELAEKSLMQKKINELIGRISREVRLRSVATQLVA